MKVLSLDSQFKIKEPRHRMGFYPHVMNCLWPVFSRIVRFRVEILEENPYFEVEKVHFHVLFHAGIDAVVISTLLHDKDKHSEHVENSGLIMCREERIVAGVSRLTNTLEDGSEFFL
jgi:hypothetical protein